MRELLLHLLCRGSCVECSQKQAELGPETPGPSLQVAALPP